MLSDRRQQILRALIEEYIACAMPVGSKTLTDNYGLGVSSATIRNELSLLEDLGYIRQPHTSAGRVPTDTGYRAFVDMLLESNASEQNDEYREAASKLKASATEIDNYLEKTSAALARMTDCLSIVLAPSVLKAHLKQISLISFTEFHLLIVLVTDDGQVFNRHVDMDLPISADELGHLQNALNEALVGKTLKDVEEGLGRGVKLATGNAHMRQLLSEVLACMQDSGVSHTHSLGLTALLAQPEFSNAASIVPVLQVLEDQTVLLEIAEDVMRSNEDPTVRIGKENVADGLSGVSMVASRYGHADTGGIVAVIGPTRMDYSRAISAVKLVRDQLEDL